MSLEGPIAIAGKGLMAGIGGLELVVILGVVLIVLGPIRTVTMARTMGKMLGQVRRAMGDLSKAVEMEELDRELRTNKEPDLKDGNSPEERP